MTNEAKPLHTGTWECKCRTYNWSPMQSCRVCGGEESHIHSVSVKPWKGKASKPAKRSISK